MNWSYLTGLFDGEGSISMIRISRYAVRLDITISIGNAPSRKLVSGFLNSQKIRHRERKYRNHLGSSAGLLISRWPDIEKFLGKVQLEAVEKLPQIELGLKAVQARKTSVGEIYMNYMKGLREQLHSHATKSRKTRISWE